MLLDDIFELIEQKYHGEKFKLCIIGKNLKNSYNVFRNPVVFLPSKKVRDRICSNIYPHRSVTSERENLKAMTKVQT